MPSFVDNFPKWIAIGSVLALAIAVSHEYGYFAIVGSYFQTVVTTYDYLANAVLWMPYSAALFGIVSIIEEQFQKPKIGVRPKLSKMAWFLCAVVAVPGAFLWFYGGALPVYSAIVILAIGIIYLANLAYATKYFHISWSLYKFIILIPIVLMFSFSYGVSTGWLDLKKTDDIYFVKLKNDEPRPLIMLRGFEKGLLVREPMSDKIELLKWDNVQTLSKISSPLRGPSPSCRWFGWWCSANIYAIP
jgi:hypothetical protein